MVAMYPDTVELFYTESKAARDSLDDVLKTYRSNVVVVLALATGAATFFGFDKTVKGFFYYLALGLYGLSAAVAARVFWPRDWQTNPANDFRLALTNSVSPLQLTKAQFDLAVAHQSAFESNLETLKRVAGWFRVAILLTIGVVIFAGINAGVQKPSVPDKPTHVVIDRG